MDYPKFVVSNLKEESISIQKVNDIDFDRDSVVFLDLKNLQINI